MNKLLEFGRFSHMKWKYIDSANLKVFKNNDLLSGIYTKNILLCNKGEKYAIPTCVITALAFCSCYNYRNSIMAVTVMSKRIKNYENKKNLDNDEGNYVIKSPYLNDETMNPCIKEQNLTTKCMYDNNYLADKCVDTFDNYTECKRFWKHVTWVRWYNNITPHLPPPEEREGVKKEMIEKFMQK